MKNPHTIIITVSTFLIVILCSFGGGNGRWDDGAPEGYTGSPADGRDCTYCHGGSASSVDGWITSDIPLEGYTAENTYTITVTLIGSGKKGFEVSPQNSQGAYVGNLTAGTQSHIVGTNYITHSNTISSNPGIWSFEWTAPPAGSGDFTFYGAFAITDNNTRLSTLEVLENNVGIEELASNVFTVYPNPVEDILNIRFSRSLKNLEIELISCSGQVIKLYEESKGIHANGNIQINIPGTTKSGLYILMVKNNKNIFTKKLCVL